MDGGRFLHRLHAQALHMASGLSELHLQTPAFRVAQDDAHVIVSLSTEAAEVRVPLLLIQACTARVAAEECTFGCYVEPLYLPCVASQLM